MAEFTTRDGCVLRYRLRGEGPLIALTPGGREPGEAVSNLADELAKGATVLTWDRRNSGASHVWFGDNGLSEQETWAQDLADLIVALDRGPAWIAGGSAGGRVSVLTALRRPEVGKGLIVWSASGGPYGCQFLGFIYHVPFIMAAQAGGMEAVAKTPYFAERIRDNPENEARILATDPEVFVAVMKRWNAFFYYRPDTPLAGATEDELRTIAMPTLLFEGNDDIHPKSVSDAMAALLPNVTLKPSPWAGQDWMDVFTGRKPGTVFDMYPMLAPHILDFIAASRV
jgi:pimeloyl-ACP methyl ester carboxylesterase